MKRFRGKSLKEALTGVKGSFGEDALILSTKRKGGFTEVLAAVDFDIEEIEKKVLDTPHDNEEIGRIRDELSEIKSLFTSLISDRMEREIAAYGHGAIRLYNELVTSGIHERLAQRLIRVSAASKAEKGKMLRESCYRLIREKTTVCNPLQKGGAPNLLAFVGPTGAGKTTTIAKLAGRINKEQRKKVGFVSIDNVRPGANEALRVCGHSLGIPLHTPRSKKEFNKVMWEFKDKSLILIDTPGRNPKDGRAIAGLGEILNIGLPIKTGLVLSMTSRDDSLFDACRGFNHLPLDYTVFTRLDEAKRFGSILNTYALLKKPVAYLCNGQRIPQDIGIASQERVGKLILQGGGCYA
ncbi:MAG: hypothetical protein GY721_06655 [Deltaproteobacteria bacterium]|nr:hypothetical protein [Deltaproteobacteria bacterium]